MARLIDVTTDAGTRNRREGEELMGAEAVKAIISDTVVALKRLCEIPDFDEDLKILCCKYIDGYTRATEKVRDNIIEAGKACAAQIKAAERAMDDTEINIEQLWQLTRRRAGLAKQLRFARVFFAAHMDARADIVSASGMNWSSYKTMKQMSEERQQARLTKQATINAERLIGLSDNKYREFLYAMGSYKTGSDGERERFHDNWLRDKEQYTPDADGVLADDGVGAGANQVADFEKARVERDYNLRVENSRLDELRLAASRVQADDDDTDPDRSREIEESYQAHIAG